MYWWLVAPLLYALVVLWVTMRHNMRTVARQLFIFHPWADAGGGAEKCLWLIIKAFAERATEDFDERGAYYMVSGGRMRYKKPIRITLFCHGTAPHIQDLFNYADRCFDLQLPSFNGKDSTWTQNTRDITRLSEWVSLRIIRLQTAHLAVRSYPFATATIRLAAGFIVAFEAALKSKGNRFDSIWDTAGVPGAASWFNWLTSFMTRKCYTYVHAPFLSYQPKHTRVVYDSVEEYIYGLSLKCYRQPMPVNSLYTLEAIRKVWPQLKMVKIYPPIDGMTEKDSRSQTFMPQVSRADTVISVGQYRDCKNQMLQLRIIKYMNDRKMILPATRFQICGSCRAHSSGSNDTRLILRLLDQADKDFGNVARVELHCHNKIEGLKWASSKYKSDPKFVVEFHVNLTYRQLMLMMQRSKVGLHTAENEHLGISVAEMALAGAYVVAHKSGGPLTDILLPPTEAEWSQVRVCREPQTSASGDCSDPEIMNLQSAELSLFPPFEPNLPLGALCTNVEQFALAIERGLKRDDSTTELVSAVAPQIIRQRFPSSDKYGHMVLDAWNLYSTHKK